jgi:hypothetical protein
MWCMYTMEYYSVIKKKEITSFGAEWMIFFLLNKHKIKAKLFCTLSQLTTLTKCSYSSLSTQGYKTIVTRHKLREFRKQMAEVKRKADFS